MDSSSVAKPSSVEELKTSHEGLKSILKKQEKKAQNLERRGGQLVGAYIFFEAFILSTVIRSPTFEDRKKWWMIFSLSLLVSIMFWITITNVIVSYLRTRYHFDVSWMEKDYVYHQLFLVRNGCTSLKPQMPRVFVPNIIIWYQRYVYIYVIVFCLLASTALMLHACVSMRLKWEPWSYTICGSYYIYMCVCNSQNSTWPNKDWWAEDRWTEEINGPP